jgi:hypothetical protein
VPADPEHTGVVPEQALAHAPQLFGLDPSVSQPSSKFAVQCNQGAAQDEAGNEHWPALQVTAPLTCGSFVQSCPHAPQL